MTLCSCQQLKLCRQSRTQWTRERCATPLFGGGSRVPDVGDMDDADVGSVGDVGDVGVVGDIDAPQHR